MAELDDVLRQLHERADAAGLDPIERLAAYPDHIPTQVCVLACALGYGPNEVLLSADLPKDPPRPTDAVARLHEALLEFMDSDS